MKKLKQAVNHLKFAAGGVRPVAGPLKVQWELTYRCNLRCTHCDIWYKPNGYELPLERKLEVIRELARENVVNISFTGGEPQILEDLPRLIRSAKDEGINVSINSNGSLMTEQNARGLVGAGLDAVYLSIDGTKPEVHDRVRGVKGSHEKVLRAVKLLQEARRNGRPKVLFNTVVNRLNLDDFTGVFALGRDLGLDGVTMSIVQNVEKFNPKDETLIREQDLPLLRSQLEKVKEIYGTMHPHGDAYLEMFPRYVEDQESLYAVRCAAGYSTVEIHPDGTVYPCLVAFARIGDLRTQSFRDVWYGEQAQEVRRRIKNCDHPICWMDCVAPLSLFLHEVRRGRVDRFMNRPFLKYVINRARA